MNSKKWFVLSTASLAGASAAWAQPDYAPAHWSPITGCTKWYTSGNGHHFCVIHDMEGYYHSTISYLQSCANTVSVYYLVNGLQNGSDNLGHAENYPSDPAAGDITQEVRESNYAWHVGCWNLWMFGTEHEGFASTPAWYSEGMYQASALLQRHLCDTYGIPKDRNHVIAHGQKLVAGWCSWLAANYPSINCTCNSHTDPGPYWDWNHFMNLINGAFNNASVVSSSVPGSVLTGQTFSVTITLNNNGTTAWTNNGANAYRLGSQSPQDNTTWGLSRVSLPSSPINAGQNASFTFNVTAPMTGGSYTFAWRMVNEGVQWFGDTFSTTINVTVPGTSLSGGWWGNADINPTSFGGGWATTGDCGNYWYIYSHFTSCAARGFNMTFNPGFQWNGRGFIHMDWVTAGSKAETVLTMRYRKQDGTLSGATTVWDDCAHTCSWQSVLDTETGDMFNWNGIYRNADEDTAGACGSICGVAPSGGREIHMYGDKWVYLNDWVTFGGFSAGAGVSDVNWSPPFGENGIYVYGAIDTSHGNYFASNLYGGHAPYRVATGDCGNAALGNYLNFKGNAGANGNNNCDNCNAYAFAWVQTPSGAGPQWGVGSDDGNRIWLNGTMIADNNAARGVTWDEDRFLPTGMAAGWNRVLFKVHNGGGGFGGVISLHNGSDFHQVEPSVYMLPDRYTGFSAGYEQDGWYPQIVVNSVYGVSSPANGTAYYGNNTTVTASGTSNGQGPVPYWRTMQYQWGYGLGNADSNYADVSGTPTGASWSHSTTGVTGHRRFHFFAVSKSGRTSFQDSGSGGGSKFQDSGDYARYYDVFIDNLPPQNPSFSSVTAASATGINLAWGIPLDQGVNIPPGSDESAGNAGNQDSQNWYRVGDVGAQVYRNGSIIYGWSSGFEGTGDSITDSGLSPNTPYTYTIEARDNSSATRGSWYNATGPTGTNITWTLSAPPVAGSIIPSNGSPVYGSNITWTAVNGFGAGQVQYYRYSWDSSPAHTWTGAETQWSSSTITTVPTAAGTWYLHVTGYNGVDMPNGTYDYAIVVSQAGLTVTANNQSKAYGQTLSFAGTEFSAVGLINSDTVTNVSLSSTGAAAGAAVAGSPYPIVPSNAQGGGLANYNIGYVNGTLTVSPVSLGVTADNKGRAYGAVNPPFSASYSGFANAETLVTSDVVGAPLLTTGAGTNSPVGVYVITNSLGSLSSTNYAFALTNGALTIGPAELTVTADDQSRAYGTPNPPLTASFTGFVNGETLATSDVVGIPLLSTGADTNSPVGTYVITNALGTLSSTNYTFDFVNGTLTVTNGVTAPPTITGINLLGDGNVHLAFSGTAGRQYVIQTALDLTPPVSWSTISTNTADGGGLFELNDLASTNYSQRFYRASTP